MRDKVKQFIYEALEDMLEGTFMLEDFKKDKDNFRILSTLDSLDMVSVLVDIEAKISDEYDLSILISADRAMSERGPFSTVETLLDFVMTIVEEETK